MARAPRPRRDRRALVPGARLATAALAALVALGLIGLAGCSRPAGPTSLFPLEPGHRWVYDVRTEWENTVIERERREILTTGEAPVGGAPAWRRRSLDGVEWYLRADDTGVYRVAARSDLDAEPRPDPQPRYVLKSPVAVGTQWQSTTTAYLLRRRADFPPEIRHSHPAVPMQYAIEALDDRVDVRAGRFERCVRVRGQAVLRLFADPVGGWRDMPLTTTEWYCHGPGLVKLVRHEPAGSAFLTGGTLTMELVRWN